MENQRLALFPPTLNCNPPPVVEAEVFSLNCFWVFSLSCSTCFGPSVFIVRSACFVSWFPLPVRIYLRQSFVFSVVFIVLYTFCFVLYLARSVLVTPSSPCIFVVPRAYISFAGVYSPPLCCPLRLSVHFSCCVCVSIAYVSLFALCQAGDRLLQLERKIQALE